MAHRSALDLQLSGYRLATAEILYHMPDHPNLLQSYVWQDYDIAPQYPVLNRFLDFWTSELEGSLHSVKLAGRQLISAAEMRVGTMFNVH
ncbi:MAG: usg protein [Parvularculaceae bacterium]|nr:usg protein [Parvularculaceae bacterium]